MYNIKTWTGLSVEESVRMTEDRDQWRKYVHGVAITQMAKEQNSCFSAAVCNFLADSVCSYDTFHSFHWHLKHTHFPAAYISH